MIPPLRFAVRVRPGASRTAVGGVHEGSRGAALVVAVRERAVEGRATEAALRAVATALGVRRSALTLVAGATARDKVVQVDQPGPDTRSRLDTLLREQR